MSILEPISGEEVLLDVSTPQYCAFNPLQLPYDMEVDRKRIIQRYILAACILQPEENIGSAAIISWKASTNVHGGVLRNPIHGATRSRGV